VSLSPNVRQEARERAAARRRDREIEAQARRLRSRAAADGKRASRVAARAARASGRATRGQGSWTAGEKTPALIIKIHRGGINGLKYSMRKGAILNSNQFSDSAADRLEEFLLDARRHPRVARENLFVHFSISAAHSLEIDSEKWKSIISRQLELMGFGGCQHVSVLHDDTENRHAHVIASRSRPDGKLVSMSHNFYKWRAHLRQVETENGFSAMPADYQRPVPTSDIAVNAQRRAARRGTPATWIDPTAVRRALAHATSPADFAHALAREGIELQVSKAADGTPRGLLLRRRGAEEYLAGSSIHRDFSLARVQSQIESNRQQIALRAQSRAQKSRPADQAGQYVPRERG